MFTHSFSLLFTFAFFNSVFVFSSLYCFITSFFLFLLRSFPFYFLFTLLLFFCSVFNLSLAFSLLFLILPIFTLLPFSCILIFPSFPPSCRLHANVTHDPLHTHLFKVSVSECFRSNHNTLLPLPWATAGIGSQSDAHMALWHHLQGHNIQSGIERLSPLKAWWERFEPYEKQKSVSYWQDVRIGLSLPFSH